MRIENMNQQTKGNIKFDYCCTWHNDRNSTRVLHSMFLYTYSISRLD